MKKFINDPKQVVDELLEGYVLAYPGFVELVDKRIVVNKDLKNQDRVAIVSLGGSGHEPCASGFIGNGMLDVFAAGDIFIAPGTDELIKAIHLADRGKGVLVVALNHAVDMISSQQAVEACRKEGIQVNRVVIQEDISAAPRSQADDRRGLVGCVPLYKIAGAAAAAGKNLDEVTAIAQRFADQMATLVVGTKGATHPVTKKLLAEFTEDEMEIGMGQHGEEGGGRQKLRSADDTAVLLLTALMRDLSLKSGEKVMLLLDGLGDTTLMEMFIVYRKCVSYLKEQGIEIVADRVGEFLTVQDAAGFQMFMARMDDELQALWNAPCNTAYFKNL
jgi:dihydroxyacetone kinase-like protein